MTTEEKRLILLKQICAGKLQKDLVEASGLNQSYLSQILNGRRIIGEKAAKNLESKLGLRPGVLVNPQCWNSLGTTPVAALFLIGSEGLTGDRISVTDEDPGFEVNAKRVAILRALVGETSRAAFCSAYSLNQSYLTNIFNGVSKFGAKSARNMEEVLELRPGVLEHPVGVEYDSPEKLQALYLHHKPGLTPKGRLLLKNLGSMLELDVLSDEQIDLLSSIASQFALPRIEALNERTELPHG